MDKKINDWLKTYTPILSIAQVEDIHYDELTYNVQNLALQRTGIENLGLKYTNDKGWKKQYQYMLLLKSSSEIDLQRLTNLEWLDDLIDWLELQNQNKNFPTLEDNKKVTKVSCANALNYQTSEDGAVSVYTLQLYFEIKGGI